MSLNRRHGILAALTLLLLFNIAMIVASLYGVPAGASFVAFISVPAMATLLSWWTVFGRSRFVSRLVGLWLMGILLWLVMFRAAHATLIFQTGFESAIFASVVVGAYLGFGLLGFLGGRFILRRRLVSGTRNEPAESPSRLQFGLRHMFVWTACAGALALLARFALKGFDWSFATSDFQNVSVLAIMLGVVSLLASPCAMLILSLEVLQQRRTLVFGVQFIGVCILENMALHFLGMQKSYTAFDFCDCCGLFFINAFQLLPIAFIFWIVRLLNYRMLNRRLILWEARQLMDEWFTSLREITRG